MRIRCPTCGFDNKPHRLGLDSEGDYRPGDAEPHQLSLRVDTIGGRGRLQVERQPLPLRSAYGVRDALRAALERVEAEIAEAEESAA